LLATKTRSTDFVEARDLVDLSAIAIVAVGFGNRVLVK
jgi:hypothetical protein